jgi:hypothetical protein
MRMDSASGSKPGQEGEEEEQERSRSEYPTDDAYCYEDEESDYKKHGQHNAMADSIRTKLSGLNDFNK